MVDPLLWAKSLCQGKRLETYISKKNRVERVQVPVCEGADEIVVVKHFQQPKKAEWEALVLAKLAGRVAAPRVLQLDREVLILEYIPGQTLADWLEDEERRDPGQIGPAAVNMLTALLDWLFDFYGAVSEDSHQALIRGDVNLRNFIVGNRLTGIDFEDVEPGDISQDLGRIAAFMLMYSPEKTEWKNKLITLWLSAAAERFDIPVAKIRQEMDAELTAMALRRKTTRS